MNLRELVIDEYQRTVTNHPTIPKELKKALRVYERVPAFLDNITKELAAPAFKNHSNNQIRKIIEDSTVFFINLVQRRAEEKAMSTAEMNRLKQAEVDKAVLNKAADTGIIDEEVIDVLKRQSESEKIGE